MTYDSSTMNSHQRTFSPTLHHHSSNSIWGHRETGAGSNHSRIRPLPDSVDASKQQQWNRQLLTMNHLIVSKAIQMLKICIDQPYEESETRDMHDSRSVQSQSIALYARSSQFS
jgi:hypothetical protein